MWLRCRSITQATATAALRETPGRAGASGRLAGQSGVSRRRPDRASRVRVFRRHPEITPLRARRGRPTERNAWLTSEPARGPVGSGRRSAVHRSRYQCGESAPGDVARDRLSGHRSDRTAAHRLRQVRAAVRRGCDEVRELARGTPAAFARDQRAGRRPRSNSDRGSNRKTALEHRTLNAPELAVNRGIKSR